MSGATGGPKTAMVLGAGLGTRMRPLTDAVPKPMVPLGGRPLIDHVLDRLAAAGVTKAVVNVHYLADVLERHLAARAEQDGTAIEISDERGAVLGTGGGVAKALPALGAEPFFIHNSDSVWIEAAPDQSSLDLLVNAWDETRMDCLLMLARRDTSLGYSGAGDFAIDAEGRLARKPQNESVPYVFAGVSIAHPRLFADAPTGKFSLNLLWNTAIEAGRLFGAVANCTWMHVGDPDALALAERQIDHDAAQPGTR